MALDKGAQAVIFDVSDDANAAAEVSVKARLQTQLYTDIFIYEISVMKKHTKMSHSHFCVFLFLLPANHPKRTTHSCEKQTPFPVPSCWWRRRMLRS